MARRLTARVAAQPTIQELLPAQDLALTLLLHDQDAGPLLDYTDQDRVLCENGLAVQKVKEGTRRISVRSTACSDRRRRSDRFLISKVSHPHRSNGMPAVLFGFFQKKSFAFNL